MMRTFFRSHICVTSVGIFGFLCVVVVSLLHKDTLIAVLWDIAPSPHLAVLSHDADFLFKAGSYHVDAAGPSAYDPGQAELLIRKAMQRNPKLQYGFHQLARLSFLKGEHDEALAYINTQILRHGTSTPTSYYVRGLIQGFRGSYTEAVADYALYLSYDPTNWAAINDYAWVLLKNNQAPEALRAVNEGLGGWPNNPWLLNSKAIAHLELGEMEKAKEVSEKARLAVANVTTGDWIQAYPGNDPQIAESGLSALQNAILANIHTISLASEHIEKNVR